MQDKKTYLYNELLIEMEKCHRNKQYEQMSEIYAEMDRIIYGDDDYGNKELMRLDNKTFFVPLLEDNSIELPKEIVKALKISSSEILSVTAVRYPDIIIINVFIDKMFLNDFSEVIDIAGFKSFDKYNVKIKENRRMKIKDYIVNAMNVKPYDTMQIDFLGGVICIRSYQVLLPY